MTSCAVALVLLLDASGSIGAADWQLQLDGHAAALESPAVHAVIEREPIAVMAFAFADHTRELLGWRLLTHPAQAILAGRELRQAARGMSGGTDIAGAIRDASAAFTDAPCEPEQAVIDVVSDGEASGPATVRARDEAYAVGIKINGLFVGHGDGAEWMREHLATPGGFVMSVQGWDMFASAVRRKIVLETASR